MIAGIGIIRRRKTKGKNVALKTFQPRKRALSPASAIRREIRERKSSAPIWPTIRIHRANARIGRPDQDARKGSRRRRSRSCQTTKAENKGTKNPCEKLGSCHHWPIRRKEWIGRARGAGRTQRR